jgi:flagellar operon protein (TIGR03826 family)
VAPSLGNCPRCRKLYLKVRDICDECYQKQEEDFLKVSSHLREYPGDTIQEVSEATKVTVSQIRLFILAGRLIVGHFPNLSYPCDICGTQIRTGKTCKNCMSAVYTHIQTDEKKVNETHSNEVKTGRYIKNYL